ncbi:TraX family protein [Caldicellulosiruptor hydrothermalis 108]|uniref:TraX family protein n=1 Tax=Caldicellulosiruptor hydrothermalis (strain DSM 18901 / VKM B-2411 / 108) TaxID=632292 RepID=E4QAL3_CALH1|nr:TraX family protein [Caldicellulosiruptor hydrothermalis]ADQ05938.1 TraX family protein [Caldicellulosiruptor hydrothermalis 108]
MDKFVLKLKSIPYFSILSKDLTKSKSNLLKLIACITMFIDHTGYLFFPQKPILRIIGRIAFPIFAYQVAVGFWHTSDHKKYLKRLLIFAIISQYPFYLMTGDGELNVIATFFFAALCLYFFKSSWYVLVIVPLAISYFVSMDYGIYGVLAVLIFYFLYEKPILQLVGFSVLTVIASYLLGWQLQVYSILSVILILFIRMFPVDFEFRLNKYFFYWFYPVHMLFLVFIGKLLGYL